MAKKQDATTAVAGSNGSHSAVNGSNQPPKAGETVSLQAPMGVFEGGYCTDRIDFQGMTRRQAAAHKRLKMSLDAANERIEMRGGRFPNGKVVHDDGDAVRWLLERLADAWEAETGLQITEGMAF